MSKEWLRDRSVASGCRGDAFVRGSHLLRVDLAAPWTYMASAIASDMRRRAARGEPGRFAVAGRGYYRLQAASAVEEAITAWNANVKARLKLRLHELDPSTFESLIAELLQRAGFEEIEVTRRERDGGIDVRAILVVGGLSRVTTAVQVKRWRRPRAGVKVGVPACERVSRSGLVCG
jgi:restriction endonuclease Mrr